MVFNYDKLWKLLIDKKMNKTELRRLSQISTNALAKMGKNEEVRLEVLARISSVLNCSIDDIITIKSKKELDEVQ